MTVEDFISVLQSANFFIHSLVVERTAVTYEGTMGSWKKANRKYMSADALGDEQWV